MLHLNIVPHYLTLFSVLYLSMYLNIFFYHCILQAMYGLSLINYCLLSIVYLMLWVNGHYII